jgi:catechol-2,3-dioxygenase
MASVKRLNHAVLYVRDATSSATFYGDALGLREANSLGNGEAIFLRAADSPNDHDLGLFTVGASGDAGPPRRVGLYHLAWEVETIDDLIAVRDRLADMGALVGASDHGATKSLYAHDPDGIEFEVMWQVPLNRWDPEIDGLRTEPLDLRAELDRFGGSTRSRTS